MKEKNSGTLLSYFSFVHKIGHIVYWALWHIWSLCVFIKIRQRANLSLQELIWLFGWGCMVILHFVVFWPFTMQSCSSQNWIKQDLYLQLLLCRMGIQNIICFYTFMFTGPPLIHHCHIWNTIAVLARIIIWNKQACLALKFSNKWEGLIDASIATFYLEQFVYVYITCSAFF